MGIAAILAIAGIGICSATGIFRVGRLFGRRRDSEQSEAADEPEPSPEKEPQGDSSVAPTFFFTDIEGSTELWQRNPEQMRAALERHNALLRGAITAHRGSIFRNVGDGFHAAFPSATDAVDAALAAQRALCSEPWEAESEIRVRIALHTGVAEPYDGDYIGHTLNRLARLIGAGHGGQILLSLATEEMVRDHLPPEASLRDLGEHLLKDLSRPERVFQLLHPAIPDNFPPLRSQTTSAPNNLPQPLTSFIGREREMAQVQGLLKAHRLVTLTGAGGAGKSRLSLQVAQTFLNTMADGAWLIELAPVTDSELVPRTAADSLGLREDRGPNILAALVEHLRSRQILLLLDNCEHVLTASAQLADTILRSCPGVRILASSREALGVPGEQTYCVPSLSLPDPRRATTAEALLTYEAARLFNERARLARPEFVVTDAHVTPITQICHRLDGIPLAIELAAARAAALSVEEIAARLDDRFRLLTGGSRTALPRQQTLRALIDWSYDLLTPQERAALLCLSVFLGGWTLEAAEAVCTGDETAEADTAAAIDVSIDRHEVVDLLTSLVQKSLVVYEPRDSPKGQEPRYRLPETMRQYALERLVDSGRSVTIRRRHRDYFVGLAEQAEPYQESREQVVWFERLEAELDNLRTALDWCEAEAGSEAVEKNLRLAAALWRFWDVYGRWNEGRARLETALGRPAPERTATLAARAKALFSFVVLNFPCGNLEISQQRLEESLALARTIGDRHLIARATLLKGHIDSNPDQGLVVVKEGLALARELEDKVGIARGLTYCWQHPLDRGDYAAARGMLDEALKLLREVGDLRGIASALQRLELTYRYEGNLVAARSTLEECLQLAQEYWHVTAQTIAWMGLAQVALIQGEYAAAQVWNDQLLAKLQELSQPAMIITALWTDGNIAKCQGDFTRARSAYEKAQTITRNLSDPCGEADCLTHLARLALWQGDTARCAALLDTADALCTDPVPQEETEDRLPPKPMRRLPQAQRAFRLVARGMLQLSQGEYAAAQKVLEEALSLQREHNLLFRRAELLCVLGWVHYGQGALLEAISHFTQSVDVGRSLSHRADIVRGLIGLGGAQTRIGDFSYAWTCLHEALLLLQNMDAPMEIAAALEATAALDIANGGDLARATRLRGAAWSLRTRIGFPIPPHEEAERALEVNTLQSELGLLAFQAAWAGGSSMTQERAIAHALSER